MDDGEKRNQEKIFKVLLNPVLTKIDVQVGEYISAYGLVA